MNSQNVQQITLWLTKLALLTSGGKTPVTKQQIGLYAVMFEDEMPIAVFTDQSLGAIVSGCEFFPSYKVLFTALQEWYEASSSRARPLAISDRFQEYLDEKLDNQAYKDRVAMRLADAKADWRDPSKVRATARKIQDSPYFQLLLGRVFAALVLKHAPENQGHLDPRWL